LKQSAYINRVNSTYAHWALQRRGDRAAIEAGLLSLAPARRPALASSSRAQEQLKNLVNEYGSGMVLDLLAGIEADHIDAVVTSNGAATDGSVAH
jgi:hypothetical protein